MSNINAYIGREETIKDQLGMMKRVEERVL